MELWRASLLRAIQKRSFFNDVTFDVLQLALGAGIVTSNRFEFRFGAAIKRMSLEEVAPVFVMETEEGDGLAYDVGIAFGVRGDESRWNFSPQFAVAGIDLGEDFAFGGSSEELPSRVNVGVSGRTASPLNDLGWTTAPLFASVVNLDATKFDGADDSIYAIGVEVAIAQIIFLRGGSQMISDYDDEPAYGFGFGAPIKSFRLRFDYGTSDSFFFEDEMSLLAAWEF